MQADQQEGRIGSAIRSVGGGLTDVPGIRVGHSTRTERPTGCTVILAESGAVAGVDVRGSAPGTIETDLLNPVNLMQEVHAIFLSGGSAFGLDVATGVRRYLYERKIGFDTRVAKVPIVPGAIVFDLGIGNRPDIWPDADCGYRAAQAAQSTRVAEGNVGAGAGATVGKSGGGAGPMKGGLGTASISLSAGPTALLVVAALVVVNAVGDVIDPATGATIAGVRTADGKGFADARKLLRAGQQPPTKPGQNTTIGVVATNARLTKVQATKVAQMAHDGLARAIYPAHTMADGDTIFALATGGIETSDVSRVGALGADMITEAIVRAVRAAESIPGYPAARDIK
ncbi:MAG: peptidase S58 family protein [Acidobacteria bacterium]|nr:peptidase S58 family protein [Acidobacteriota bacterium]